MALLLLLDTSGPQSTAALARDGALLALHQHAGERDGAAVLNRLVEAALGDAGIGFPDLDGIAVLAGPGSYTGLRVAVSAAKGYCLALDRPLLGANRLELLARQAAAEHLNAAVVAAMPARPGEWFTALYAPGGSCTLQPAHRLETEVLEDLRTVHERIIWAGSMPPSILEFQGMTIHNPEGILDLEAWCLHSEGQWKHQQFESLHTFAPFYLKAPFIANKKNI